MWWPFPFLAFADDKCPVDHKNMSNEQLDGMMAQYKRVGHDKFLAGLAESEKSQQPSAKPSPASPSPPENPDACPVDHKNMTPDQIAAYMSSRKKDTQSAPDATPPQPPDAPVYDVYGQELDRANLMPTTPNQLPSPGQKQPLSTDRVKSTIPKAGEDADQTWTYPSPQMFFNAPR